MTSATASGVGLATAWRIVSLGFAPPTGETLAEVEALADALAEVEATPELDAVLTEVRAAAADDVAAQFAALFRGNVLVAPYEASYELDPIRQGRQMADVAAFYRAFGAEAHGPAAERPDFVGCELEFLSFLELRRLAAVESNEESLDVLDGIRRSFLADHAGRWLPRFFAAVESAAVSAPLYRALAKLGATLVAAELGRHGIEASPLPGRGAASSLDADTLECGGNGLGVPM